jgi:hypothetical protein
MLQKCLSAPAQITVEKFWTLWSGEGPDWVVATGYYIRMNEARNYTARFEWNCKTSECIKIYIQMDDLNDQLTHEETVQICRGLISLWVQGETPGLNWTGVEQRLMLGDKLLENLPPITRLKAVSVQLDLPPLEYEYEDNLIVSVNYYRGDEKKASYVVFSKGPDSEESFTRSKICGEEAGLLSKQEEDRLFNVGMTLIEHGQEEFIRKALKFRRKEAWQHYLDKLSERLDQEGEDDGLLVEYACALDEYQCTYMDDGEDECKRANTDDEVQKEIDQYISEHYSEAMDNDVLENSK